MATALRTIMSAHRRKQIEGEIGMLLNRVEQLLARIDREDARFEDLEDDDPAGDPLDEKGEAPADDGGLVLTQRPLYGIDQSCGPTNVQAANREWHRSMLAR